ncbi:type IV pilus major pilin [Superficieibacter sp.]|uniref:type IV pilus major pilin n=1 Tax=Superficieibacter sp. TaxID=2303322 RepID=UPI0028A9F759|nr:type IV pilus major pilin [Superficieibacter sp.]
MKNMINSWKRKASRYQELKKQEGVTLLEIIIVLGIIGIIAAGVVILAQRAFTSQDITGVADSTNTVRVSMNDVYKNSGYPDTYNSIVAVAQDDLAASTIDNPIIAMVKMGKLTPQEAINSFSRDPLEVHPALTDSTGTAGKAFVVVVNGLDQEQCRSFVSQVGSDWDYVETIEGALPGADSGVDDTKALNSPATGAVLKSTVGSNLTPNYIANTAEVCADQNGANGVVLGSR